MHQETLELLKSENYELKLARERAEEERDRANAKLVAMWKQLHEEQEAAAELRRQLEGLEDTHTPRPHWSKLQVTRRRPRLRSAGPSGAGETPVLPVVQD